MVLLTNMVHFSPQCNLLQGINYSKLFKTRSNTSNHAESTKNNPRLTSLLPFAIIFIIVVVDGIIVDTGAVGGVVDDRLGDVQLDLGDGRPVGQGIGGARQLHVSINRTGNVSLCCID